MCVCVCMKVLVCLCVGIWCVYVCVYMCVNLWKRNFCVGVYVCLCVFGWVYVCVPVCLCVWCINSMMHNTFLEKCPLKTKMSFRESLAFSATNRPREKSETCKGQKDFLSRTQRALWREHLDSYRDVRHLITNWYNV